MKNVPVGPLSAVSPRTLESVFLVLRWYLDGRNHTPPGAAPSWQDEQVAMEFALSIRRAATLRALEEGG